MRSAQFQLPVAGEAGLHVRAWAPEGMPRAGLLVVHGMAEHGGRYARFAEALVSDEMLVMAPDLPGHGLSATPEERGHLGNGDAWGRCLEHLHTLRLQLAAQLAGAPLFIFGHSMGSFLVQRYLTQHGTGLAGAILSGTTGSMGALRKTGLALLRLEARLLGARHRSALAEALTFKAYARRFRPRRTDFDWLSRDPAEVDRYIADPLCGFRCSAATWIALLRAGADLVDPARLARIPQTLPVLLIAGARDPVSGGASGPHILERAYRAAGLRDITTRIYPEGRHELLNDICRDEVTTQLREWLRNHSDRGQS